MFVTRKKGKTMIIKPCTIEYIDDAMQIFDDARAYMRANGNLSQWGNGYPSKEVILQDMAANRFYGVFDGDK